MRAIYSVLFLMLLLLTGHTLSAQLPQIIGFTAIGGTNNLGILYKINYDGSGFTPVYSFASSTGYNPAGVKLTLASNNILYGLNQKGGANGKGCLFSFDPVKNIYKDIIDFNGSNGNYPRGGLVLANNGLLYGTTYGGGSADRGVIFSFDPVLNTYTVLYAFVSDGFEPACTMLQASDGKLYGTTIAGGPYGGTIYSFNIATNAYTSIYTFGYDNNFENPEGSLVEYNGVLYGFMNIFYPLEYSYDMIFDFNLATKTLSYIQSGTALSTILTPDLFGTTFWGLNTGTQQIYTISTKTNSYNAVYTFPANGSKGLTPKDGLINHNPNKFYGVTNAGGSYDGGVLYTYYLGVNTKLHDFTGGAGGAVPYGVLTGVPCTQKPAKPGTITGSGGTATCNKTKKYTINRISGATSYKWTVPAGATIQGASTDTVITVLWGKTSGDVTVQASNTCGTSAKQTKKVTVSCSAKELIADDAIAATAAGVTPNPTTGNITVHFTSNTSSKYTVNVIDVAGKVLLTREVNAVSGSNTLKFDLSKLAKGIYYIQLSGEADKKNFKVVLE